MDFSNVDQVGDHHENERDEDHPEDSSEPDLPQEIYDDFNQRVFEQVEIVSFTEIFQEILSFLVIEDPVELNASDL